MSDTHHTSNRNRVPAWLIGVLMAGGILIAIVIGVVQYANAVPALFSDPSKVPAATEIAPPARWEAAAARGRELARAAITSQNLPALSIAVGAGQDVVWAEGFGWADIARQMPIKPGLRFRLGHASVPLTSAGAGLLREQGLLHLDDEIQKYVPAYPKKAWPVTVRQLMGHLAGVKHYAGEEADVPSGHCGTAADGVASFANDPLLFEPGTQYRYSTYGWVLVSAAIEAAAQQPFASFMQTRVFDPLGMHDTTADASPGPAPDRVTFYFPRFSGDNAFGHDIARDVDYSCFAGAGAFLSTPADLVRFGLALQNGKLLQPGTVSLLQAPQALASGKDTEYGLGWNVERVTVAGQSTRMVSHASRSLIGASASFLTFPDLGLVVAVTSNTSYAGTRSIALSVAEAFAK